MLGLRWIADHKHKLKAVAMAPRPIEFIAEKFQKLSKLPAASVHRTALRT